MTSFWHWTSYWQWAPSFSGYYLLGSRFLTHAVFWFTYYLLFSVIWHKPENGLFASFFLEFILMPVRIMAAYCMLYVLIPSFLQQRKYQSFFLGYIALILGAGFLQMLFGFFFYENLVINSSDNFALSLGGWVRNVILINTTVLLLGACKVFLLFIALQERQATQERVPQNNETGHNNEFITVKSERRSHRLNISDILYLEGMGNYVTYHLQGSDKKVVYSSLKEAQKQLPENFIRLHRSYLINKNVIESFDNEQVFISGKAIPRGKDIEDAQLMM